MESIQRTKGRRVRVRRTAMRVGSEGKKESERTKEGDEEGHEGEGADAPGRDLSICKMVVVCPLVLYVGEL